MASLCPSCGAMMYPAKLLKNGKGLPPDRETCALHGPNGMFRHLGSDRKPASPRPTTTGGDE